MKFLLTNDDGIHAEGLIQLASSISSLGEVTVIAPEMERSATGHAITMYYPLRIREVKFPGLSVKAYAVDGTPADCVKLGIDELLNYKPDFVLTGINRGVNLGTDVLYSGTVSAAIEGCVMGVPSLAFSLEIGDEMSYSLAGRIAVDVVKMLADKDLTSSTLVNINIPNVPEDQIKGMKVTRLGNRRYSKSYIKRQDPRGRTYYWLAGELIEEASAPDTDIEAIRNHYISITPLHYDLTSYGMLDLFRKWEFDKESNYE